MDPRMAIPEVCIAYHQTIAVTGEIASDSHRDRDHDRDLERRMVTFHRSCRNLVNYAQLALARRVKGHHEVRQYRLELHTSATTCYKALCRLNHLAHWKRQMHTLPLLLKG